MVYVLVHRNQPLPFAVIKVLLFPSGEPGRSLEVLISEIIHAENVPPNHFFIFFKWKKWSTCREQDGKILHRAAVWRWGVTGVIVIAACWDRWLWCCVVAVPASLYARAYSNTERKDSDDHKALGFSHMIQDLPPGDCRGRKGEEAGGGMRIITW